MSRADSGRTDRSAALCPQRPLPLTPKLAPMSSPARSRRWDIVFLDRDGTINVRPGDGWVERPEDLVLLPGAGDAIRRLNESGIPVAVVSNQRGVSLGRMTHEAVQAIHARLDTELAASGAHIDGYYYCSHGDGVCDCRKPLPGLLHAAVRDLGITEPVRAAMVGDTEVDVRTARAFGASPVLVGSEAVEGVRHAPDLGAAVALLLDGPPDLAEVPRLEVCGVPIVALGPSAACDLVCRLRAGTHVAVHLCNAYTLSLGLRDGEFRDLLRRGELNLADGQPVARLLRHRGADAVDNRVYGPDLLLDVASKGVDSGLRHYLYGGAPGVAEKLAAALRKHAPAIRIVGVETPPYRDLTERELHELGARVSAAGADVVWVGLGTPRQDVFIDRARETISAPCVGVGAAFDFLTGLKPQAPTWMQQAGLEWLFRLATEPRRLWRRYLIGNSVFVWGAAREQLQLRRRRRTSERL